jgi:signal transduction histidine kinase
MKRLRMGSVRARVTGAALAIVGGSLLAGALALFLVLTNSFVRSVRTDAQVRATEVSMLALRAPLPQVLPASIGDRPTLKQVVDSSGKVLAASADLVGRAALLNGGDKQNQSGTRKDLAIDNEVSTWWVQVVPATISGQAMLVVVATSMGELRRTTNQLVGLLAIGIPFLTIAAGLLAWTIVGRALRPVEEIRSEVEALVRNPKQRSTRITESRSDDELRRLTQTMNRLLDSSEAAAQAQRRFVADASHELRGPVANIRVAIEVAQAHPELADWLMVSNEVLTQDERMGRLVDNLLLLARVDGDATYRREEIVDLSSLVTEARRFLTSSGIPVHVQHCDPTVTFDDRVQLQSIVNNLVENAVRFATSSVHISLVSTGSWAELTVADDGPGVPITERQFIFDRFYRVDEHRSREGGGAGLGLAIVARYVSDRQGSISVGSANPGAVFTVRLPLRRPDPRELASAPKLSQ